MTLVSHTPAVLPSNRSAEFSPGRATGRSGPARARSRSALAALALAAGLGLGSCSSFDMTPEAEPEWLYDHMDVTSTTLIWEVTLIALEKLRFPIGSGLNPATMTATSGWKVSLAPFHRDGFRQQAIVEYTPGIDGEGWDIRVRVKKEVNNALAKPLDITYAEWESVPDDTLTAGILLQHIRARLRPGLEFQEPEPDPLEKWRIEDDR